MPETVWQEIGAFFNVAIAHRDRLLLEDRQRAERDGAMAVLGSQAPKKSVTAALALPSDAPGPVRSDLAPATDLVMVREDLRGRLKELEGTLTVALREREKYFALFPIVIYVDELLRQATHGRSEAWESLQSELYGIENGGERFYSVLDELMRLGDTHPTVFEVFYFCLNHGFKGQYATEPTAARIDALKERLAPRIPVVALPATRDSVASIAVTIHSVPWHYYAASLSVVIGAYLVMRLAGYIIGVS